jgi:thioredoxin-like negative regulator of GroEL
MINNKNTVIKLVVLLCCILTGSACDKLLPGNKHGKADAVSLPARGTLLTVSEPEYFNDVVFHSTNPVLVLFYAAESVPSSPFRKTFQALVPCYSDTVVFAEVNLSENTVAELEQQYTVSAVPSLLLLDRSLERIRITGALSLASVTNLLDTLLQ